MPTTSRENRGARTSHCRVVFYDRRENPNSTYYRLYRARSTDGGSTFTNEPVADAISDVTFDQNPFGGWMGDYCGSASSQTSLYPFWCDIRNQTQPEGYVANVATGPPFPCPSETPNVIDSSMQGFSSSGPSSGTMTLHFVFRTTQLADALQVQYKVGINGSWQLLDCANATCRWNCDGTVEVLKVYSPCGQSKFYWQAKAGRTCIGWQSGWSALKTFTSLCLEEP